MELSRDKWPIVQEVFESVLQQAPPQRMQFLDQVTDDAEVRKFVEILLAGHESSGTLLPERPQEVLGRIFTEESSTDWVGRDLGNYRIEKKIGEGGMGLVFQGRRNDKAFEKKVAVKLVQGHRSNAKNRERFLRERQILARIEHPHIARLIDGGQVDRVPYLVMEKVDGIPVTQFCDVHHWDLHQRINLFRKICDAVQFAHQNLIVHGDIKPSNILVTEEGSPKLLDFGIATLLKEEEGASYPQSASTQNRMLTPGYASPEQLLGKPMTTASDIYSLGVLLFELLCGFRPFSSGKRAMGEVEAALTYRDPTMPSNALTQDGREEKKSPLVEIASFRASSPKHLRRSLRGDLDAIALKALSWNPQERYATAAQLSEDLNRYLKGEPVWARRQTWVYRWRKFAKRNRVAVTLGVLLALAGLSFTVYTRYQSLRLANERDLALASTKLFVESFQMADPNKAKGESVTAREILENAEEKIDREHGEHPELQASLRAAMGQVYLNLNLTEKAEPLIVKALEAQTDRFGEKDHRVLATKDSMVQLLFNKGLYEDAEKIALETLNQRRVSGASPNLIAANLTLLANARRAKGERREAIPLMEEALTLLREDADFDPLKLARAMNGLAYSLTLISEYERAESLYLEGLSLQKAKFSEPYPLTARMYRGLCNLYLRWGKPEAAEPYLEAALRMNRKLYGQQHPRIAVNLHDWGKLKQKIGDPEMAEGLYRESLGMKTKLLGPDHPGLIGTLINLAALLHGRGALEESEAYFRQAHRIHMTRFKKENINLAFLNLRFGKLLRDLGHEEEAERHLCNSVDGFLRFSSKPLKRYAEAKMELVPLWMVQERHHEARIALKECLTIFESLGDKTRTDHILKLLSGDQIMVRKVPATH